MSDFGYSWNFQALRCHPGPTLRKDKALQAKTFEMFLGPSFDLKIGAWETMLSILGNRPSPFSGVFNCSFTLPKFNMEPENGTLEKESPFGNDHFKIPC